MGAKWGPSLLAFHFIPSIVLNLTRFFILVGLPFANFASAAELFVSPTGSDSSGTGSIISPFKTVDHASDLLQPGDTLSIRGGVYTNATYGQGTPPLRYYKLERTGGGSTLTTFLVGEHGQRWYFGGCMRQTGSPSAGDSGFLEHQQGANSQVTPEPSSLPT